MPKMYRNLLKSVLFCLWCATQAAAQELPPGDYLQRADVREYVAELTRDHGFAAADLQTLFAPLRKRTDIIERISNPAETVWTWARYRRLLVDDARIARGVTFWAEHAQTLAAVHERYGVAPEYVLAILAIETRFGQHKGKFPVLESLMTLGFDYPPRAKFFRKELTQFLLLAREEGKDPSALVGSYAGAMGYGQFISSSYRHYAVDFDGDGVRDIWDNPVDAIGSIANYFARHRWQDGAPVAFQLAVADPDGTAWRSSLNQGLKLTRSLASLAEEGAVPKALDDLLESAPETRCGVFLFDAEEGDEFWVVLPNFYAITRYNHSHMYAMAVHQLAGSIKQGFAARAQSVPEDV
ncbi:MAG: lytic murein transglycosylase B [Pseudomonadota bacterium]